MGLARDRRWRVPGGCLVLLRASGQRPWPFTGGTVTRVVIDVSGEAFIDVAREAAAAFARQ
jgi:hypothetical protein